MSTSLDQGDLEQVRFLAHRLKGTAGVYGLEPVSALAGEIEGAADDVESADRLAVLGTGAGRTRRTGIMTGLRVRVAYALRPRL
jgi:HPt (histidine-containing phosphotransfer) domain-containing protein